MYRVLPASVLGVLTLAAITANTFLAACPMLLFGIVKFVVPSEGWRHWWTQVLVFVAESWIRVNNLILTATQPTVFEFRGTDDPRLQRNGRYLVTSNHQNWSDVLVLQRLLIGRAPFLRFFIKQELIWFPILGQAWWALDMPFMKRYSPATLAKHPELKGKDLETTRRACERFRRGPISIMNFIEGTRFTKEKHDRQQSPYRHLLRPKAGGFASVLEALSGDLDTLVDVTIVYSSGAMKLWDFVSGGVGRVVCEVAVHEIPPDLRGGSYSEDEAYRERFQTWLRELWEAKDARIAELQPSVVAS